MIEALDETIKRILVEKIPLDLNEVDISFDVPNKEWSTAISKPTINIYLFDVRENLELRPNEWSSERTDDGKVVKTRMAGRFDLSYLITAWTKEAEDEHRLLWYVLTVLMKYPHIPYDMMEEPLKNQPYPMITKVAQPDSVLRNLADVWNALENQFKPVLPYTVTVALLPYVNFVSPEVRSRFIRYAPPDPDAVEKVRRNDYQPIFSGNGNNGNGNNGNGKVAAAEYVRTVPEGMVQTVQIGGYVRDANEPNRIVQGEVILLEQGLNVRTDPQGRYKFGNVKAGEKFTLLVVAPGYATTRQEIVVPADNYDITVQPEG